MITFLSTVRWRYRRHVAQLCCWRLATLTGRGSGGGDDNVPFDCKMTLPKTRCPTLPPTSCWRLSSSLLFPLRFELLVLSETVRMVTFPSRQNARRPRISFFTMVYLVHSNVRSWQFRFAHQHQYIQTLGKLFKTKNADWKSTEEERMHWTSSRCCGIAKVFVWHFDLLHQTSKHHRSQP